MMVNQETEKHLEDGDYSETAEERSLFCDLQNVFENRNVLQQIPAYAGMTASCCVFVFFLLLILKG